MSFDSSLPKLVFKFDYRMIGKFGFLGIDGTGNGSMTLGAQIIHILFAIDTKMKNAQVSNEWLLT